MGNAQRLVAIFGVDHQQGQDRQRSSLPDYRDVVAQSTVFEDVAARFAAASSCLLTGGGDPSRRLRGRSSPANVVPHRGGVPAVVGRTILPDEGAREGMPSPRCAHRFWKSHFAGDPSIVGPRHPAQRPQATRWWA